MCDVYCTMLVCCVLCVHVRGIHAVTVQDGVAGDTVVLEVEVVDIVSSMLRNMLHTT